MDCLSRLNIIKRTLFLADRIALVLSLIHIFKIDTYAYDDEAVLVAGNGNLNVKYFYGKFNAYQRTYILTKKENLKVNIKYIYYF